MHVLVGCIRALRSCVAFVRCIRALHWWVAFVRCTSASRKVAMELIVDPYTLLVQISLDAACTPISFSLVQLHSTHVGSAFLVRLRVMLLGIFGLECIGYLFLLLDHYTQSSVELRARAWDAPLPRRGHMIANHLHPQGPHDCKPFTFAGAT